jgi:hypothetical protein
MPYAPFSNDNWTEEAVLKWEKKRQDIISNWDLFLMQKGDGFEIKRYKNAEGGQIRWHVDVNAPTVIPGGYPKADYAYPVFRHATHATLNFVPFSEPCFIPAEELDLLGANSDAEIDLKVHHYQRAERTMVETINQQIWNGTGIVPGQLTGLDSGIDNAAGTNIYAGINRTTYPRWQANVDATGFALWYGTVATNIFPLWVRSQVAGIKPDLMACAMTPLSAFVHMAANRQVSHEVPAQPVALGLYTPKMYILGMRVVWGGDNMPAGENGNDIFGIRSDGIAIQYVGRSWIMTEPWRPYQGNDGQYMNIRSHCQFQVYNPENHFRIRDMTVPDDPTENPSES